MITDRRVTIAVLVIAAMIARGEAAKAQTNDEASCAQKLTEQLRRINEKCIRDLVAFTASLPKGSARIASEKDRYYVDLSRAEDGLRGESVSKQNFAFMTAETQDKLKVLGWTPPDVEFGGFKRMFSNQDVQSGAAAQDVIKALEAYGMKTGEAISVSVAEGEK